MLATIHAAKGLEFGCVRVVGLEEGMLPQHRSLAGAALEEERRLCYVAMTRARAALVLSAARLRAAAGQRRVSRFIAEASLESRGGCPYGFVKGCLGGECDLRLGGRSCRPGLFAVAEAGAEHGVDDVAAAAGEADDGSVVLFAFGALASVVVA
jgi:UvrD-like helicase C-terminal domain